MIPVTRIPDPRWSAKNQVEYFSIAQQAHVIKDGRTAIQYAKVIDAVSEEIYNRRSRIIIPKLIITHDP